MKVDVVVKHCAFDTVRTLVIALSDRHLLSESRLLFANVIIL